MSYKEDATAADESLEWDHSHWSSETILPDPISPSEGTSKSSAIIDIGEKYRDLLCLFYSHSLSTIPPQALLWSIFPGLLVWRRPIPVDWLQDISNLDSEQVYHALSENSQFLYQWDSFIGEDYSFLYPITKQVHINPHLGSFLRNRHRAGANLYRDPTHHRIDACAQLVRTVSNVEWLKVSRSVGLLTEHV